MKIMLNGDHHTPGVIYSGTIDVSVMKCRGLYPTESRPTCNDNKPVTAVDF